MRDKANGRGIIYYANNDKYDGDVLKYISYIYFNYLLVSGLMEQNMDKEVIFLEMEVDMKVIG